MHEDRAIHRVTGGLAEIRLTRDRGNAIDPAR